MIENRREVLGSSYIKQEEGEREQEQICNVGKTI